MSREHIDHNHIQDFADRVVNLKQEDAKAYRDQVNRLRDKLNDFLNDNPDFELKKTLLSGSLAKHTALKSINDIDVAIYVDSAPDDVGELTNWLAEKLRKAFPNFNDEQVVVQNYSVKIEFRGTGLDVDVVPVYADVDDWGQLVSQEDGTRLRTNITLHKEFIAKRRKDHSNFAQMARLLKWWAKVKKAEDADFKFKSFMVELVLAKLYDEGKVSNVDDYPETMVEFFDYLVKTNFNEAVYFTDYTNDPALCDHPIRVFDPVNAENNVARKYGEETRDVIVDAAADAGDAIDAALRARTKGLTVHYWTKVFGASFN